MRRVGWLGGRRRGREVALGGEVEGRLVAGRSTATAAIVAVHEERGARLQRSIVALRGRFLLLPLALLAGDEATQTAHVGVDHCLDVACLERVA